MLLDSSLQRPLVRADDLADLFSVLEEQKGRHGADAELLRDVADLVNVDLEELGLRVLFAELGDLGGDDLAGAAPSGEAVEDDERVGVGTEDLGVVGGFTTYR